MSCDDLDEGYDVALCTTCWARTEYLEHNFEVDDGQGTLANLSFCESCWNDIRQELGLSDDDVEFFPAKTTEAMAAWAFPTTAEHLARVALVAGNDDVMFHAGVSRWAYHAGLHVASRYRVSDADRALLAPTSLLLRQVCTSLYTQHCEELLERLDRRVPCDTLTTAEVFALMAEVDTGEIFDVAPWYAAFKKELADKLGIPGSACHTGVAPGMTAQLWQGLQSRILVDRTSGRMRDMEVHPTVAPGVRATWATPEPTTLNLAGVTTGRTPSA